METKTDRLLTPSMRLIPIFPFEYAIAELQILPVNIKSLAGSTATLANWFCAWIVTLTANIMLNWSGGGLPSLPPPLFLYMRTHLFSICLSFTFGMFGFFYRWVLHATYISKMQLVNPKQ